MRRRAMLELRDALVSERQTWDEILERATTPGMVESARRGAAHCDKKLRLVEAELCRSHVLAISGLR